MFVEKFREFFSVSHEKHAVQIAQLDLFKLWCKAASDINQLICKQLSVPFSKTYAVLNFLSFDNQKYIKTIQQKKFWGLDRISLSESGYDALEEQAQLLLQPLSVSLWVAQLGLEYFSSKNTKSAINSLLQHVCTLSSAISSSLSMLVLTRQALSTKKSTNALKKSWLQEKSFTKPLQKQILETFLDVCGFSLKLTSCISPTWCKSTIKTVQCCINLLKIPEKLNKQHKKIEKAIVNYESAALEQLRQLCAKELPKQEFIHEFFQIFQKISKSTNVELLTHFRDILEKELREDQEIEF